MRRGGFAFGVLLWVTVPARAHAADGDAESLFVQGNTLVTQGRKLDVRAAASGLELRIDDVVVPRAKWTEERALDPGTHWVSATANDRTRWQLVASAREGAVTPTTASTAGNVATVGFIADGVALAAAVVVWLTAPSVRPSAKVGAWIF